MKFHTKYNPAPKICVNQTGEKTRTVQSEKDSCDVNKIMERFERTGQVSHIVSATPHFQDNSQVLPYEEALMTIEHAKSEFMSLPAKTRQYFEQDPKKFVSTILNPNEDDLKFFEKNGIIIRRPKTVEATLEEIAENTKNLGKIDKEPGTV